MSFFTSLTGLNAATTQLSVTSNNIANAGTTGFKRSRSDFGDIYATSPLQKASTVVGQGTALKQVTQEFSQGNIELSGNSLDLAVTGEGFFPIDTGDGEDQKVYTRNGSFLLNDDNEVVNSVGQNLLVADVRSDGSADFDADLKNLVIDPQTNGLAEATSEINLNVNLPTSSRPILTDSLTPSVVPFDLASPSKTYAVSSAINIYDSTGREVPLNVYYRRLEVATADSPENKWETHIVVNGKEVKSELSQATGPAGKPIFVDKYGVEYSPDELPPGKVTDNTVFPKYVYDEIGEPEVSKPARAVGSEVTLNYKTGEDGVQFGPNVASLRIDLPDPDLPISEGAEYDFVFIDPSTDLITQRISSVRPASALVTVDGESELVVGDTIHFRLQDATAPDNQEPIGIKVEVSESFTLEGLIDDLNNEVRALANSSAVASMKEAGVPELDAAAALVIFEPGEAAAKAAALAEGMSEAEALAAVAVFAPGEAAAKAAALAEGMSEASASAAATSAAEDGADIDTVKNAIQAVDGGTANDAQATAAAERALDAFRNGAGTAAAKAAIQAVDGGTANDAQATVAAERATDAFVNGAGAAAAKAAILAVDGGTANDAQATDAANAAFLANGSKKPVVDADALKATLIASGVSPEIAEQAAIRAIPIFSRVAQYEFDLNQVEVDRDGNTFDQIEIRNNLGRDFQIGLGADHVPKSGVGFFESISEQGAYLTKGSLSPFTANGGRVLDNTPGALVEALNRSAVETDFEFVLTESGQIEVVNQRGENFELEIQRGGEVANLVVKSFDPSADGVSAPDLSRAFQLLVDQDPNFPADTRTQSIDLSALTQNDLSKLTGDQVANLMTKEINRQLGDERYFDLTQASSRQFRIVWNDTPTDPTSSRAYDVTIPWKTTQVDSPAKWTADLLAQEIQSQLREQSGTRINVSYDSGSHGFRFLPENSDTQLRIRNVPAEASITGAVIANTLFGLPNVGSDLLIDSRGSYDADVNPNGLEILPAEQGQQRYGLKVEFIPSSDEAKRGGSFAILSGKTGDGSAIAISQISEDAQRLFGFVPSDQDTLTVAASTSPVAVRGIESLPAKVVGKPVGFNPDNVFAVDNLTNSFTVTVNNVTETFRIPVGNDYDINKLRTTLQDRINAMADAQGNTVSGVSVSFDQVAQVFKFETGNTGNNAFLQVRGPSFFGLAGLESGVGSTQTYRNPVPALTENEVQIFVKLGPDGIYQEFSSDVEAGYRSLPDDAVFDPNAPPEYSPAFIGTGQLTFDTSGNLIFPSSPLTYKAIEVSDGSSLDLTIDFGRSSQNADDFSVNSQSQDGRPEGSLVSLDIADDGAVTASYSNGAALAKGRIVLMRFPTPNGLRQLGDSTFLPSKQSGLPVPGTPGQPGYGTIRAGARERANVDLTSELVDLITAQRNFQANAKAIETSSTLTSTIINIRS